MHPQMIGFPAAGEEPIVLRLPLDSDFDVLASIRRDPTIQSMLMAIPDATDDEAVKSWIERRHSDGAFRIVADTTTNEALGFVQISQIHRRNRHGYGGLALLGSARGHGRGHVTVALLTRLASDALGLSKLLLEVREDNLVALKVYRAAGFRIVGTLEDHFRDRDGKAHNVLLLERLLMGLQS